MVQTDGTRGVRRAFGRWAAGMAAALAGGCGGSAPQDFMFGSGPAGHWLAHLGWFVLLTFSAVTVIVWAMIAWLAMRRRGTLLEHEPVDVNHGQRWIVIGGFAIPAAVFAIVFVVTLTSMKAFPMGHDRDHHAASSYQVVVTGQQWWFNAQYSFDGRPDLQVTAPTEIHVPVGQPVDIALQTRDVIHSFWIPKLHGKVDLIPGQVNYIRIQADAPGIYRGQCGEYCGAQHANMRLDVVAETPANYQAWLDAQRAPAAAPATDDQRRGRQIFETSACVLCHTVRGTPAQGRFGPDLTHVASRHWIAGGALQNDTANLSAWVTHAQSLKPGAKMPNLTQFTGEDLRALVAYVQSLK